MHRVMLVDDERIIAEGIMNIIQRFGLGFDDFKICEDGKEALEELEEYKPDVIFTDIRMTYMDGLELSRRIRGRKDGLKDIPIVIVTGYSDFNYAKKAIAYNVFGYLLKPIDKQELYDILLKLGSCFENKNKRTSPKEPYLLNEDILRSIADRSEDKTAAAELFTSHGLAISDYTGFYAVGFQMDLYAGLRVDPQNHILDEAQSDHNHACLMRCFQSVRNCLLSSNTDGFMLVCLLGVKKDMPVDDLWMCTDIYGKAFAEYLKKAGIHVFISSFFSDIHALHRAYAEIFTVKDYRKLITDTWILTFENIRERTKKGPIHIKEIDGILEGIDKGNLQILADQFDSIAEFVKNNKELSIEYVECIYSNLCMEVYKRFYSVSLYQKFLEIFEFFINIKSLIDRSRSFEEIHARIREKILDFCMKYTKDCILDIEKKDIITAVRKLIEKSYAQQDLSLHSVADKLHISGPHLSTLFKKEAGMSFHEYVSQVRVNKSMLLLESGKIPISEIGKMIGYTSEKHFFVVFKRYTGMSPAKYRLKLSYKSL